MSVPNAESAREVQKRDLETIKAIAAHYERVRRATLRAAQQPANTQDVQISLDLTQS
jgi:hypothetical protein